MIDSLKRIIGICLRIQNQLACYMLLIVLDCFSGNAYPTGTNESRIIAFLFQYDNNNSGIAHIRVKRSNESSVPQKQYANAVEEFYADPNNRAMYLVLPLIVLIYGGCSSIYCIHKCCRYVKRKKLEKEMQMRERLTSETGSCNEMEETSEKQNFETEASSSVDTGNQNKANGIEVSPPPAYNNSLLEDEELPLEDFEDYSGMQGNQKDLSRHNESHQSNHEEKKSYSHQETSFIDEQKNKQSVDWNKISEDNRSMDQVNNNSVSSAKTSRSQSRPKPSPPPAYEKRTSPDGKSSRGKEQYDLTPRDIEDILNYYSDKKHMPDVIPDDTENVVPLKKKIKKWKHRVFNG